MSRLRIGTRGSDLALWQARFVREHLADAEIVVLKTAGDQNRDRALHEVSGTGFFTKEIEAALMTGRVDIAVHSFKDLPTQLTSGLVIAAVPERGPVADVLVRRLAAESPNELWGVPRNARVGTGSLRRRAQLLSRRPDLEIVPLRGNVPTRFDKVTNGQLDAVVLAEAGLMRLGLDTGAPRRGVMIERIDPIDVCPAPAQGALAIQVRREDEASREQVAALHHPSTAFAVEVERQLLARFGGGCHLPLGALCMPREDEYELYALVAAPAGEERIEASHVDTDPNRLVEIVYAELVRRGATRYL